MDETALSSTGNALLRQLPSIERLLGMPETAALISLYGRALTTEAMRQVLDSRRQEIKANIDSASITPEYLINDARQWLEATLAPTLTPVINATGIIVHTNLGRAPLSTSAQEAMGRIAGSYSTLEYDPVAGKRGSRTIHCEELLTQLTGADAALVVNNNAGAVLLMLRALCNGRDVIISRGQLVEIGGGFRIPDVMAQSGSNLVEVGTTNRTHLSDYEAAIDENTAAILVAHHSNYKIVGFTTEPSIAELADLAHHHGLMLLYDQGSGALVDVSSFGLEPEPTVQDSLRAGCDVVAFSGDKMLGGPQAGILCGLDDLLTLIKKHPLARAVRADKLCLASLNATLAHYLKDEAFACIPVLRMIAMPAAEIQATASRWQAKLEAEGVSAELLDGQSRIGGGSMPGTTLPTRLVTLDPQAGSADQLAARLRQCPVPVIGRIQGDHVLLDPRTVLPDQEEHLLNSVVSASQADGRQDME